MAEDPLKCTGLSGRFLLDNEPWKLSGRISSMMMSWVEGWDIGHEMIGCYWWPIIHIVDNICMALIHPLRREYWENIISCANMVLEDVQDLEKKEKVT